MSRTGAAITTALLLAGVVVGLLLWQQNQGFQPQLLRQQPAEQEQPQETEAAEPEIRFPVEETEAAAEPVPELDASDDAFRRATGELIGASSFKQLFYPQDIVRRIVVTIDNLPREVVADRLRPLKPAGGKFAVEQKDGTPQIATANYARYRPYVSALERIDPETFGKVYTRFYPLFQTAYRDLGYPKGYFNDRLVTVIDHLLATPEPAQPLTLVQPHILYRYADPQLESASAGHKLMWRMGPDNAKRVKAQLRKIRAVVTAGVAEGVKDGGKEAP